jgi:hypothetical protein
VRSDESRDEDDEKKHTFMLAWEISSFAPVFVMTVNGVSQIRPNLLP